MRHVLRDAIATPLVSCEQMWELKAHAEANAGRAGFFREMLDVIEQRATDSPVAKLRQYGQPPEVHQPVIRSIKCKSRRLVADTRNDGASATECAPHGVERLLMGS